MGEGIIHAVGSRKSAVAKVWLKPGDGKMVINGKNPLEYIKREDLLNDLLSPLRLTGLDKKFNIVVKVEGGGLSGQAGAIRLGIAKAVVLMDSSFKSTLKNAGLLRRDPREKERMKYGLAKRRKRFQWTKR